MDMAVDAHKSGHVVFRSPVLPLRRPSNCPLRPSLPAVPAHANHVNRIPEKAAIFVCSRLVRSARVLPHATILTTR